MTSTFHPGAIVVRADATNGHLKDVEIRSSRPLSLASRFCGQRVDIVQATVGTLHSLCGASHACAFRLAAAAASDDIIDDTEKRGWLMRLAAERVAEHVRTLFTSNDPCVALHLDLSRLRWAMRLANEIAHGVTVDEDKVRDLASTVRGLGLGVMCEHAGDLSGTFVAAGGERRPLDRLQERDDEAVAAALAASDRFSALPSLPGRCPETGAAARQGRSASVRCASVRARVWELSEAAEVLSHRGAAEFLSWAVFEPRKDGTGFCALESPRGRLIYLVRVGYDGTMLDARTVAPTEWNFHPAGPFWAAIDGLEVAPGEAVAVLKEMAWAFDPCVGVEFEVETGLA